MNQACRHAVITGTIILVSCHGDIDGLEQERRKSSVLALELRLSCTNQSTGICNSLKIEHPIISSVGPDFQVSSSELT